MAIAKKWPTKKVPTKQDPGRTASKNHVKAATKAANPTSKKVG